MIEACEPERHLVVVTKDADESNAGRIELTLAAEGRHTRLVWEEQVPADLLAEYGAGIQIHVEDLASHVAGRDRCDAQARWQELIPLYRALQPGHE